MEINLTPASKGAALHKTRPVLATGQPKGREAINLRELREYRELRFSLDFVG